MRNLGRGNTGDDVSMLQNFLRNAGDLHDASSTGFFGDATEHALGQWQVRMGIATSGDAITSGFGFLGPKTREMLMRQCKELLGYKNNAGGNASTSPFTGGTQPAPTCVLFADKTTIAVGATAILVWDSKNATSASSVTGERGPAHGYIRVTPTETTTYLKKVYGAGGEGSCTITVTVASTTPNPTPKVVFNIDLGHVFSLMGSGVAAVMDGYLSLFGMSLE
jgi:hypothetical protein